MNIAEQLLSQIRQMWDQWTLRQRSWIVGSLLVSGATVIGVVTWATRPESVVLASRLSPAESAELVSRLEAERIDHELNFAGSAISVSRSDLARARLAGAELLGESSSSGDAEDGQNPWDPPALQNDRLQRQQELRLARSIMKIRGIHSASVHIGRASSSPFLRDTAPTTASVVVEMQPGAVLAPEQARSLISLVAHGVEGLTEEHVTVLDTEGRLLSPHRGPSTEVLAQLDYQTRFEMGLAAKAETMLEQMLGPGRATVRVTADIDFTDIKRTETRYDPDSEVKKNETVTSITQSGSPRPAAGIPGTASNLTPPTPAASGEGAYKEEHTSTDFENAKIDETVHELPGKLQRLTVAAIVDLPAETTEGTTAGPTAQDVEAIIQRAVGFDSTRSDEIQVVIAPLETSRQLEQDLLTATTWERYAQLVTSASLGIAAVVALAVTLLILRRLRPIVIPTEGPRQFTPEQLNKVIEISQLAQENSTVAAEVLKAWINEHSESHSDDEIPRSSARRAA